MSSQHLILQEAKCYFLLRDLHGYHYFIREPHHRHIISKAYNAPLQQTYKTTEYIACQIPCVCSILWKSYIYFQAISQHQQNWAVHIVKNLIMFLLIVQTLVGFSCGGLNPVQNILIALRHWKQFTRPILSMHILLHQR